MNTQLTFKFNGLVLNGQPAEIITLAAAIIHWLDQQGHMDTLMNTIASGRGGVRISDEKSMQPLDCDHLRHEDRELGARCLKALSSTVMLQLVTNRGGSDEARLYLEGFVAEWVVSWADDIEGVDGDGVVAGPHAESVVKYSSWWRSLIRVMSDPELRRLLTLWLRDGKTVYEFIEALLRGAGN